MLVIQLQQRWTDKEVVERVIENIKTHWQIIDENLKKEDGWQGTWKNFIVNWIFWNDRIHAFYYHIEQLQNILDIKDEELEEILKDN